MDRKTAIITVNTSDGEKGEFVIYKDITFPKEYIDLCIKKDMAAHMQDVRNCDVDESDVFLATYNKAGTHWAWEAISMLMQGSADYIKVDKETMFIDFVSPTKVSSLPSPKCINSHFTPRCIPRQVLEKGVKVVHVQRNVKDVLVSFYNHMKFEKSAFTGDFATFFNYFTGAFGVYNYCSWAHYVKEWEYFTKKHPQQILNIFYEDMKEDSVREIGKINTFLKTDRSEDLVKEIADACSFDKLKRADLEKEHGMGVPGDYIYRKGEVGDWKNWFTVAQNEIMDQWIEENFTNTDLTFRYTL